MAPAASADPEDAAGVVRLRCAAEGDSSVGREDVLIRRDGNVHFRIEAGLPADLLYARRPKDIGISRATELPSPTTTGTFYRELSLGRGPWLVGCFAGAFSARDHPPEDYALIRVVEAD
jgi:hypothetical protein